MVLKSIVVTMVVISYDGCSGGVHILTFVVPVGVTNCGAGFWLRHFCVVLWLMASSFCGVSPCPWRRHFSVFCHDGIVVLWRQPCLMAASFCGPWRPHFSVSFVMTASSFGGVVVL